LGFPVTYAERLRAEIERLERLRQAFTSALAVEAIEGAIKRALARLAAAEG